MSAMTPEERARRWLDRESVSFDDGDRLAADVLSLTAELNHVKKVISDAAPIIMPMVMEKLWPVLDALRPILAALDTEESTEQ